MVTVVTFDGWVGGGSNSLKGDLALKRGQIGVVGTLLQGRIDLVFGFFATKESILLAVMPRTRARWVASRGTYPL